MSGDYGSCPMCGAPGNSRERRPNGDDTCENGHKYPSRLATHTEGSYFLVTIPIPNYDDTGIFENPIYVRAKHSPTLHDMIQLTQMMHVRSITFEDYTGGYLVMCEMLRRLTDFPMLSALHVEKSVQVPKVGQHGPGHITVRKLHFEEIK